MTNNAIVGQSGGPTSVINASLAGVFQAADGCGKVYGMRNGIQGLLEGKYINMADYIRTDMDLELLKRTPSAFLGSCRYKLPGPEAGEDVYKKIFSILKELGIGYFFYIGGNDSMDTIMKLSQYGEAIGSHIRFMGVPKTIDNDLPVTDHTPGFGSAAKYIATTTKEVLLDAYVYKSKAVTILEVMGRNAGWLAGAAALSRGADCCGPDYIFLPEIVFDVNSFLDKTAKLVEKGPAIIVLSEGIKTAGGEYVAELYSSIGQTDAFGHKTLTGAARYLADQVSQKIGCKARAIELSTTQRCAAHINSAVDVTEAAMAGGAAVKAALGGASGQVAILKRLSDSPYTCVADLVNVDQIANVEKKVPKEWIVPTGDNVTDEFVRYARPLIQGELSQVMVGGLPQHIVIKDY